MHRPRLFKVIAPLLVLGYGLGSRGAAADERPASEGPTELLPAPERPPSAIREDETPPHEATRLDDMDRTAKPIDRGPPPAIAERPGVRPPDARARWVEGYWDWDRIRKDFVWVTGTWRAPPAGAKFWVNGYWRRDETGWVRVPGFWCGRKDDRPDGRKDDRPDWHKDGPPRDRPKETIGPAPGADYFYITGHYAPEGTEVVWKPGYWARSEPGWEWVPARWVRQSDGWVFRPGAWRHVGGASPRPARGTSARGTIVSSRGGAGTSVRESPVETDVSSAPNDDSRLLHAAPRLPSRSMPPGGGWDQFPGAPRWPSDAPRAAGPPTARGSDRPSPG
jgi:hypothetical protein